jgi:hypothetical protein
MEQIFWWVCTGHAQAILESQLEYNVQVLMQRVKTEDNTVTFQAVGSSGQFSLSGTWNWRVREGYMYTLDLTGNSRKSKNWF